MQPAGHVGQSAELALTAADRAVAMAAYMRDRFPFLGIPTTPRRRLQRAAWKPLPKPTFRSDVLTIADQLWALPEREYLDLVKQAGFVDVVGKRSLSGGQLEGVEVYSLAVSARKG